MSNARPPDGHRIRFYRQLAANIRRLREAAGMSQKQLASACGVGFSTLNKWEDGTTSIPAYSLHLLEVALGVNHYDLAPTMSGDEDDEAAA